jgi:type IV pilus assembly protein PilQ
MTQLIMSSRCLALVFLACALLCAGACVSAAEKQPQDKPTAETSEAAAAPELEITKSERGISVHAVGVQADELFTKLAREAGVGIIVDDTVGRRQGDKFTSRQITLNLTNKKINEIIEYVCTAYGLSHSQVGKVFMISEGIPKNPSSYLMSDIDSVTTAYVLSSKAKSLLPEFLQAHVKVNEGKNAVILSAPAEVLAKFREDIKQFDVPASQIMIDVIMVEFTDAAAKELGFDFLWSSAGKSVSAASGTGELIFRTLGSLTDEFSAKIKALEEQKKARVHANPRIATVSGQKASIFVGRQRYLSQPVELATGGSVNFIDAGIRLEMTPWTGGEGEVITEINAEVSVMSAPDPVTGLPEKSTRQVNTQVRVRDGETIIIGGLVQTELQLTTSRIPLLGDLPVLGTFFRSLNRRETKTELVIFITPRVLTEKESLSEPEKKTLLEQLGSEPKTENRLKARSLE